MSPFHNKDYLIANLCFLYRTMVASVPLLEFAALKSAGKLARYYRRHIRQEQGHEVILKNDLLALGVQDIPHYHIAAQLAGSQYYFIAHEHPAMLLGYMLVMEGTALNQAQVASLEKFHKINLVCMMHHAKVDQEHTAEIRQQIKNLPIALQDRIMWNAHGVTATLRGVGDILWQAANLEQEAA